MYAPYLSTYSCQTKPIHTGKRTTVFLGTFIEIAIFLMKMRCMREKDSSSQSKTREYFDCIIPIMLKFSSIFTRIASTLQMSSTNQLHPFDTRLQKVWLEPRNRIVFGKHQTHARHES